MSSSPPPDYNQEEFNSGVELMALHLLLQQRNGMAPTNAINAGVNRSERPGRNAGASRRSQQKKDKTSDDGLDENNGAWDTILRGLAGIIIAPIMLGAGAVFAVGAILLGVGKVLQGLGTFLTWGTFQ